MSVDVASLPAWKLALLERKRRQEIDTDVGLLKSDGNETLGKMPPWKQEILFRKQQKRHSTGRTYDGLAGENRRSLSEILLSPEDSDRCGMETAWPVLLSPVRDATYYGDLKTTYRLSNTAVDHTSESEHNDAPVEEERLPPVHQNPILLLDLEKRHQSGFLVSLSSPGASDPQQRSSLPSKLSKLQVNSHDDVDGNEHIECENSEDQGDSVFREEEVTYGKGFVSRLLQRFSYLSGREDQPIAPPFFRSLSRGQSSEDFTRHHYDPDVRSKKRNAVRKKANSLDDLLTDGLIGRSIVENGSTMNDRDGTIDPSSSAEGHAEVGGIVLNAKSIFESLATSPTSLKNPLFVHERHYTSVSRNHETQEGQRSAENHKEANRRDGKDNTNASSAPTMSRSNFSSTHPHHPPAIIGPKPVYTGKHFVSLQSAESQPKKYTDAQRSCDVVIKSTKYAAEKPTNSAQTSVKSDLKVSFNDKTDPDLSKNIGSIHEIRSLFDSSDAKHPDHDSKDHKTHQTISAHRPTEEPSKVKERVPEPSTSVPAHSVSAPAPSTSVPAHSDSVPAHPISVPAHPISVPAHPISAPAHPISAPAHPISVPAHPISVPAHPISVPATSTSVPAHSISVPAPSTSVPAHPISVLAHPISVPAHPISAPVSSTSVPAHPISVPAHPISVPAHPISVPAHPISVPAHPISAPAQVEKSAVDKTHEPTRKENATAPKKADATAAKKPGPSRPGLLLIRPASNLTTTPRTEYLQMTKYNDITKGEFAPAKRSIHKSGGGSDDDDSDADEADGSRDRSKYLKVRFEFEGGGVRVGRSLLAKTKQGIQLKINFDDAATSTYEYPSEQSLIDCMPAEPGDVDYRSTGGQQNGKALPSSDVATVPNHSKVDSGTPASASNAASNSSSSVDLSSYKSKTQVDFEFDSRSMKSDQETLAMPSVDSKLNQATIAAKSDDDGVSWSDSTSSDHVLF